MTEETASESSKAAAQPKLALFRSAAKAHEAVNKFNLAGGEMRARRINDWNSPDGRVGWAIHWSSWAAPGTELYLAEDGLWRTWDSF